MTEAIAIQAPGVPKSVVDTGKRPKVSVVLGVRNEYPVILGTILSFVEELEFWGYPWEIVVVDNLSTDNTAWILKDKLRRWMRQKPPLLKVIEYNEKPANVLVRNIGAEQATGEVVFLADGHLSIKTGTLHGMVQNWLKRGGLWHSAIHIWGDTTAIRCYGYDLKLKERFWGNLCRGIPKQAYKNEVPYPYRVPMASHCCLMAGREEYLEAGGYNPHFQCYGGGEPYLDLKWWLLGKEVWIYPEGLIRHAFGVNASWRKVKKDKKVRNYVQLKDGRQTSQLKEGDEYLHYSRGYFWTNEHFQHNFLLAAFTIGGYEWFRQRYQVYFEGRKGNPRYVEELQRIRADVLREGFPDRQFIAARQVMSLNELIEKKPWEKFDDL